MGLISWRLPWRGQVCSGVPPLTAPPHLCQRKLLLFLYSEAADRFCSKRSNALGGEFSPAGPGRQQGLCVRSRPRHRRDPAAEAAQAGSVCLGRRRERALAARQPRCFLSPLFAQAFRKTIGSDEGFPVPAAPASAARLGDLPQSPPRCGTGCVRGIPLRLKTPHGGGAMGVKSVHEAGRRLPEMSAVPRKSYGRQTNKARNTQIRCRLHYLGHGSNKGEHRETWQVPPCTDTTTPMVKEPGRCWECPCTALGLPDTVRDPDCPCRSVCGPNRAQTGSDMFLVPGKFPVTRTDSQELTSPR